MLHLESKSYEELTKDELYRILQLRSEVFVVEQDCVYLDPDGKDHQGYHVLGWIDNEIMAYTRIFGPGIMYNDYSAIGRVVTSDKIRKDGHGRALMTYSIESCSQLYPSHPCKISAQSYLIKFYTELGFVTDGEEYLEDGIPHIAMIRQV